MIILVLTHISFTGVSMTQRKFFLPYLKQFRFGIVWTLIDSIGSQGLVILYHLFYRSYAGASEHGAMGCLLSLVYLCIALTNIGLDKSLAPFLETFSASRKRLHLFTLIFLLPQGIFLTILSALCFTYFPSLQKMIPLLTSLTPYLSQSLMGYIILTFIFESLRKTLRTFLQLSFYFRFAALVELLGIGLNLAGIIVLYKQSTLTLHASWQILAVTSLIQLILLCLGMIWLYLSLSKEEPDTLSTYALFTRVTKTRIFSWGLQSLNQLYSGNFLVPVCALQFGIASASLMKVITSISYWITLLAKKVFGITSNALLARIKSRSPETQTQAFHFLTEVFNQALYGVLIFLMINGKKIVLHQFDGAPTVTWSLLYFMLILTFFESFFILYERWYILEEDAQTYLGFNLASIGLLYFVVKTLHSPLAILSAIICIRVITFILLSLFSFYRWKIRPSLKPHLKTIIGAVMISGICYILL